jgi:hypothetical protein
MGPGFAWTPPYTLTPGRPTPGLTYPSASPHRYPPRPPWVRPEGQPPREDVLGLARAQRYRNINRLCIDYALRPRLSSRLTLGGLALPRNPWASGGGVSHPSLATHTRILTRARSTVASASASLLRPTLPYRSQPSLPAAARPSTRWAGRAVWKPAASALGLSPVELSAQDHSTSELLRTL